MGIIRLVRKYVGMILPIEGLGLFTFYFLYLGLTERRDDIHNGPPDPPLKSVLLKIQTNQCNLKQYNLTPHEKITRTIF